MLGAPGAGKTFFARQIAENLEFGHISGERIRYELFDTPRYDEQENEIVLRMMDYIAEVLLTSGTSVIYDDVSLVDYAERQRRREMAQQNNLPTFTVWVQTDNATAFNRASTRDRRRSDEKYSHSIDKATFERLNGELDQPQYREEFMVISGKYLHKNQAAVFLKKLKELKLITETPDAPRPPAPVVRSLSSPRRQQPTRNIRIR